MDCSLWISLVVAPKVAWFRNRDASSVDIDTVALGGVDPAAADVLSSPADEHAVIANEATAHTDKRNLSRNFTQFNRDRLHI